MSLVVGQTDASLDVSAVVKGHSDSRHGRTDVRLVVSRLATAVLLLFAVGLATAAAQPAEKMPRVGYISPGSRSDPVRQRRLEGFRQGLRDLGYVEGRNIAIESRWAEGKYDRYPGLAADLVRLKVRVIVAVGGGASEPGGPTSDQHDSDRHVGRYRSLGRRTRVQSCAPPRKRHGGLDDGP